MPQISLYIDQATLKKIGSAAKNQHVSISKWVAEQLRLKVDAVYPEHFDELFGSINDNTFLEAAELSDNLDIKREQI